MSPRPPRPTLFPYTTLFRSLRRSVRRHRGPPWPATASGPSGLPCHPPAARPHRRGRRCASAATGGPPPRSEEHTSEFQSQSNLVCRLLLEKKKKNRTKCHTV